MVLAIHLAKYLVHNTHCIAIEQSRRAKDLTLTHHEKHGIK